MATLKELGVRIIGGQIISRVIYDEKMNEPIVDANRRTIVSKTVGEGIIEDEDVVYNNYRVTLDENRLTRVGDIVMKLSSPYNAVLIDKDHEGMLVSSFCVIIRDVYEVLPEYLVAFLNSKVCQDQIAKLVIGKTTMANVISNEKIYRISIPVPNYEKQREIGGFFSLLMKKSKLFSKMLKLENEKIEAMISIEGEKENG